MIWSQVYGGAFLLSHKLLKLFLFTALQHHEPIQDQEFALATLAACSAATHVRKRQIRRLLDIASGEVSNVGKYL